MALQSSVNTEYAKGVPGDMVNPGFGQNVFTPINPMADGPVNVGSFVFPGSDPYTMASNAATVDTAGTDTYAVALTPTTEGASFSGNITVENNGSEIVLLSSVGAINQTASAETSGTATLTIPVGADFAGSVNIGSVKVAEVADGTATPEETLEATGTSSKLTVASTEYDGTNITITFSVSWTAKGTAEKVMGFVVRVVQYPNYVLTSEGTLQVPSGHGLAVAVRGDFYAVSNAAATVGQAVFASTTDGSISTGTVGDSVDGCVETDFIVKQGGAAGDLIVISNQ